MQQLHDHPELDAMLESIAPSMHTQPEEAIRLCERVFEEARRVREPLAHVIAAEYYGLIMDHLGRGVEARNTLYAAQQLAQSTLLFANEANLLEQIARGYYTAGQYRQAIQYWARCIEVSDQAGRDPRIWILAKIGLSQVYCGLGDYASGLALLAEAESRVHEVDDPHLDAKIKINQGVDLAEMNRGDEAALAFSKALGLCVKHDFFDYAAESNFRLAQLQLAGSNLDDAMCHLDAALTNARRVNYRWVEAHILATQAEVHAQRHDYRMAMETVKAAQAIATSNSFLHMLVQQHFAAARYAKATGDLQTALEEFMAGHACEQRILTGSASERNKELEEKAGLRPSISRLLVELSNNQLIEEGQLDPAFQLITQESSRILDVARVSIWLLDLQTGTLVCRCLYQTDTGEFAKEATWRRADCTTYFDRLSDHNPLVAHDAAHHPHTWELEKFYLAARNIKSMLVFPIWLAGQTAGILSFEAVGEQRNWTPDDIVHGNQLVEVTARVIASYERKLFQQEINGLNARMIQANEMLEARVIERTASLERHNTELHTLNDRLYEMRHQLQQAQKMAAIGELAAGLAQEIAPSVDHIMDTLSALEKHHADLLSLLAEYEALEATLPEADRNRIDRRKQECRLDYLRSDLSHLTTEIRRSMARVQDVASSLKPAG